MEHERIALVTGANSGIGKITAKELAKKGMRVLMVCRDAHKGEVARNEIITESRNQRVDLFLCDLSDQDSIVKLATAVRSQYQHLDLLINNAGLIMEKRLTTPQELEYTFALNHLAPFLLTHLLLDQLRKGDDARIITVSSEAHRFAKLDFNDLQAEKQYSPIRTYANSKLANILFTHQLSSILKADGISANCLHPGVVSTNFGGSFQGGFSRLLLWLGRPFFISPEKGAETSIFLASSSEVKGVTGLYFDKKKPRKPSEPALSQFNAQKLWDLSLELTRMEQRLKIIAHV